MFGMIKLVQKALMLWADIGKGVVQIMLMVNAQNLAVLLLFNNFILFLFLSIR